MEKAEPLCDLRYVKAEYQVVDPTDRSSEGCFRIKSLLSGKGSSTFALPRKTANNLLQS